jgi:hypothetical protein
MRGDLGAIGRLSSAPEQTLEAPLCCGSFSTFKALATFLPHAPRATGAVGSLRRPAIWRLTLINRQPECIGSGAQKFIFRQYLQPSSGVCS